LGWRLRIAEGAVRQALVALQEIGIVHQPDPMDGDLWCVTHFAKRQARVPNAERKRQERVRKRKGEYVGHDTVTTCVTKRDTDTDTESDTEKEEEVLPPQNYCHEPVTIRDTKRDTDTDTDTDTEKKEEEEGAPRKNVFVIYEENIGVLTPLIADELNEAEETHTAQWVGEAIKIAARNGKRSWAYVKAILNRWRTDGYGIDKRPPGGNRKGSTGKGLVETQFIRDPNWQAEYEEKKKRMRAEFQRTKPVSVGGEDAANN